MKIPNLLRYNRKTINYMTNNFTFNNFFETNHEMGVIIITPKQVAISYRKMGKNITHSVMIENMLKVLEIENNIPIVSIRCYSYSDKSGGCNSFAIGNKKITQEMYDIVNKIYEKVTNISSKILSNTAEELVKTESLEIDNSAVKDER